jgi:wnt family
VCRYLGLQTGMVSTAVQLPPSDMNIRSSPDQQLTDAEAGNEQCTHLPGLVMAQLEVCQRNPMAMPCVGLGARLGLYECRYQFQYERWNCSISPSVAPSTPPAGNQTTLDTLIQLGQYHVA